MTNRRSRRDESSDRAAPPHGARSDGASSPRAGHPAELSPWLRYGDSGLAADGIPLIEIARSVGTPTYVYSAEQIERNVGWLQDAFSKLPVSIFYAVKANPNGAILRLLARMGLGAEVVSGGELFRALRSGFAAERIAFSGVGKTDAEIEAALHVGVGTLILESVEELLVVEALAGREGRRASVALRLHPSISAGTHPYLATGECETKFGLEKKGFRTALELLERSDLLDLVGLHAHIGSQIASVAPYVESCRALLDAEKVARDRGHRLRFVDLGGGFAIPYGDEDRLFPLADLVDAIGAGRPGHLEIRIEPGRLLVGDAGLLLVRTLYTKACGSKEFVIVDAGMNALVRPALYGARHRVRAVEPRSGSAHVVDVVGPICENADFLARDCSLPPLKRGDLVVVLDAGAYGFSMASQYNSQARPAEVVVHGGRAKLVRVRETYTNLVEGEASDPADDEACAVPSAEDRLRGGIGGEEPRPPCVCNAGCTGRDRSRKGEACE